MLIDTPSGTVNSIPFRRRINPNDARTALRHTGRTRPTEVVPDRDTSSGDSREGVVGLVHPGDYREGGRWVLRGTARRTFARGSSLRRTRAIHDDQVPTCSNAEGRVGLQGLCEVDPSGRDGDLVSPARREGNAEGTAEEGAGSNPIGHPTGIVA